MLRDKLQTMWTSAQIDAENSHSLKLLTHPPETWHQLYINVHSFWLRLKGSLWKNYQPGRGREKYFPIKHPGKSRGFQKKFKWLLTFLSIWRAGSSRIKGRCSFLILKVHIIKHLCIWSTLSLQYTQYKEKPSFEF